MPKVMMIGKVSKLKSRTRRAGSFKGSLGTVVLEGSRAKSRRYGMGNIAGTKEEHLAQGKKGVENLERGVQALRKVPCDKDPRNQGSRLTRMMDMMRYAGRVGAHLSEAGIKTDAAPGAPGGMPTFPPNDLGYRYRRAVRDIVRATRLCTPVMSNKWDVFEARAHGEAPQTNRNLVLEDYRAYGVKGARRRRRR